MRQAFGVLLALACAVGTETDPFDKIRGEERAATGCFKVRMKQRALHRANATIPESLTSPEEIALYEAENGFIGVDDDDITPRFSLTLVCRCAERPDTTNYRHKHGAAVEVPCAGITTGGAKYDLAEERLGQCFALSQRTGLMGILPAPTPYFLSVPEPLEWPLTYTKSYFRAGQFNLSSLDYFAVCTKDGKYFSPQQYTQRRREERSRSKTPDIQWFEGQVVPDKVAVAI